MQPLNIYQSKGRTHTIVLTGLLFATSIVLSLLEGMLPPLPIAVPGVKFGLSNIAVMYALFFIGPLPAYGIAILKSAFVVVTRGMVAGLLSLSGGLLSITLMLILYFLLKSRVSYVIISVTGAISHNLGQFAVIALIYVGASVWFYLPVLIISGVASGILTAVLLKAVLPAIRHWFK
ncbi:MAG: Gx transporter family protein [Clostridia bacterium]|nr:Gx transporter family protein [Clostridia bacterium]